MENKMPDLIGETIGEYQIVEKIGKGGMAEVYRAYQPSLNRDVAVKVLPAYYAEQDDTFLSRFKIEAQAIASLRHPNILMVMSYGEHKGITYIVMEYVPAGTLKDRMAEEMSLAEILEILRQVGSALDYAHEKGVVHRDVKPSNVLMPKRDWALLTDFGLARMVGGSNLTQSGMTVGTPSYMSPEQGSGNKVDFRSDIYSLGVMLYEMTVGELPYQAETPMAVVVKHIVEPLPMPRSRNPLIPEDLQKVILKAMAKNPDDRYQSAKEMVTDLEACVRSFEAKFGAGAVLEDGADTIIFDEMDTAPGVEPPEPVEEPKTTFVEKKPGSAAKKPQQKKDSFNWKLALIIAGGAVVVGLVAAGLLFGGFALAQLNRDPTPTPFTPPPTLAPPTRPPIQQATREPVGGPEPTLQPTLQPTLDQPAPTIAPQPTQPAGGPPLPQGEILFQDDFADPNSGWDRYTDPDGSTEYVDGMYVISIQNSDYSFWANPGQYYEGPITVQVETVLLSGTEDNAFGVICGYQDVDNFFVAVISSDGYYGFYQIIQGEFTLIGDSMQLSDAIHLNGRMNVMRVDCLPNRIVLGVNGQFVDELTGINVLPGDIGFWAETLDGNPAEIGFDNIFVSVPVGP